MKSVFNHQKSRYLFKNETFIFNPLEVVCVAVARHPTSSGLKIIFIYVGALRITLKYSVRTMRIQHSNHLTSYNVELIERRVCKICYLPYLTFILLFYLFIVVPASSSHVLPVEYQI